MLIQCVVRSTLVYVQITLCAHVVNVRFTFLHILIALHLGESTQLAAVDANVATINNVCDVTRAFCNARCASR